MGAQFMIWKPITEAEEFKISRKPIFVMCVHDNNAFIDSYHFTVYGAHCEIFPHTEDGPQVVVWGGGMSGGEGLDAYDIPPWWYRYGSNFQEVANPILFLPIPECMLMLPDNSTFSQISLAMH
jgi:hypothetical protein